LPEQYFRCPADFCRFDLYGAEGQSGQRPII